MNAGVESIGVCYGMVGDNLPTASDVIKLYQSNSISAMRIYAPESNTLIALKGTGISLMMSVPDDKLSSFANNAAATQWVQDNIVAYPGVSFKYIFSVLSLFFFVFFFE
jgi:Glycosyl hydrolases family 17